MEDEKHSRQAPSASKKRPNQHFDNGKKKKINSREDDGNTKPIETLYRILCPVKKIGSVLGHGGDIINALRGETNAKIRVADSIPGAEERVIIVYNFLSDHSREVYEGHADDADVKDLENMKPLCPAQDALLKIHDRIAADELLHNSDAQDKNESEDVVTARILVPNNQVGCLLGKGGHIIQKLRSDTGAGIRIMPADQLPPCAMEIDELVQLSGSPLLVRRALYEISTRLHQHPRKENPPIDEVIYASTHSAREPPSMPRGDPVWPYHQGARAPPPPPSMPWFDEYGSRPSNHPPSGHFIGRADAPMEEFAVRVLCSTGKIGGVIGKGGSVVRQLELQTGTRIHVEDTVPDAGERIIIISSKEMTLDPFSPAIDALLQLQSKISAFSEKGHVTTRLLIPSIKVGCILGEGGRIVTEMRRRLRADIRIFSKDDKPKFISADDELVQVSGIPEVAREAVAEIASRLRARTFRNAAAAAGNSPPYAPPPPHPRGPPYAGYPPPMRDYPPQRRSFSNEPYDPFSGSAPPEDRMPLGPYRGYPSENHMPPHVQNAQPLGPYRGYPAENQMPPGVQNAQHFGSYRGYQPEDHIPPGVQNAQHLGSYRGYPTEDHFPPGVQNAQPHGSYRGYPTEDRMPGRDVTYGGAQAANSAPVAYHGYSHQDASYTIGPQSSGLVISGNSNAYDYTEAAGARHEPVSHPGPPPSGTAYPNAAGSVEVRIPQVALDSVVGPGGSNLEEIHMLSGAKVKLQDYQPGSSDSVIEIQGTPEQTKAAQSLLQAYMANHVQDAPPQPPSGPSAYQPSAFEPSVFQPSVFQPSVYQPSAWR